MKKNKNNLNENTKFWKETLKRATENFKLARIYEQLIFEIDKGEKMNHKLNEARAKRLHPSTTLSKYINEKSRYSDEHFAKLVTKNKGKLNQRDLDELIKKYSKMMANLIWKNEQSILAKGDISFDEVFHLMIINIVRGLKTFKIDKNTKLITHLYTWCKEVIYNPLHFMDKFSNKKTVVSIDKKIVNNSGDKSKTIGDTIKDKDTPDMYDDYDKSKNMKRMLKIIDTKLKPIEQKILKIKIGLDPESDKYTNKSGKPVDKLIGNDLGISSMYVKKIYDKALEKVKENL